jgi:5'-3' exoribonuclease 1
MEYIRLLRAQPDYHPNVRLCLYGLDADLIMLGLLSHDLRFCLLREKVKFGLSRKKANKLRLVVVATTTLRNVADFSSVVGPSLEAINFYLLHL